MPETQVFSIKVKLKLLNISVVLMSQNLRQIGQRVNEYTEKQTPNKRYIFNEK